MRKMKTQIVGMMFFLYGILWGVYAPLRTEAMEIPGIQVPRCEVPPVMDGRLDEPAWDTAWVASNFTIISGRDKGQTTTNCTARIMRDDAWLYVGFDIHHPQPTTIAPKVTQRNERVQGENCVKVAFDPGTGGKLWYHIRLSAGNVISDQRSINGSFDRGWNCPIRSAVHITETGWQAELALPFAMLMEMGEPAEARINFLAHVFEPILDPHGVEIGQERTVWSWAPVGESWWRTPELFGRATGLAGVAFKAPFLPRLESAVIGEYRLENNRYFYDVTASVGNTSSREGILILRVRDEPDGATPTATDVSLKLPGGAVEQAIVPVPVEAVGKRSVRVEMLTHDKTEILERILIENPPILDLFTAYLDRNYYTTEETALVVCETGFPSEALTGTSLLVTGTDGREWGVMRTVMPRTEVILPLNEVAEGRHALTVTHRRPDGGMISEQKLELIKRAPKPGMEWKIDRINRMVLHDGQPKFIYGVLMGGYNADAHSEENYREIAEAGFDAVVYWAARDSSPAATLEALDTAQRHGLLMGVQTCSFAKSLNPTGLPDGMRFGGFTHFKCFVMKQLPTRVERSRIFADVYRQAEPLIKAGIEAVKDHPAFMFYEGFDEPVADHWFDQYVQGREMYKLIHDTDGYHPKRVLWNYPPSGQKYTDWTDILGIDPYWAPPVKGMRSSPNYVAKETARLTARGERERKPVWITPVFEMYSAHYKRVTLPEEQRAQTWLAIIQQASGFFYFIYPGMHQVTWDMMKVLGHQLKELRPMLTAPLPTQRITYEPTGFDPENEIMPDVQVLLRKNPTGGYVLLAANAQPWPVTTVFSLNLPDMPDKASRMFSPDTHPVQSGKITDQFEPYGVRAYVISASKQTNTIEIIVTTDSHKDDWRPEPEIQRTGRSGKRNIMPDPSFEEASIPYYPDYWWIGAASHPARSDQRTGNVNARFTLDDNNPYHGQYSYRISGYTYFKLSPQHDRATDYVWSVWARAENDGVEMRFRGSGVKTTSVKLTREWQRYHVPVRVGAHAYRHAKYAISAHGGPVWVDAVQFEQGVEPTEFEP